MATGPENVDTRPTLGSGNTHRMRFTLSSLKRKRFTLIELLVVIAIIAILAAMLLPVLGRAKYRARLVLCMNIQRQLGQGLHMYADTYDDRYPYVYAGGAKAQTIRYGSAGCRRDMLKGEFPINDLLNCPLTPVQKDYENSTSTWIEASYDIYAGYGIGNSKLDRIGKTLDYNGVSYNVLAMDFIMGRSGAWAESTHPDYGTGSAYDDSRSRPYCARWASYARGPIDINVLYGDGAVFEFSRVRINDSRFDLIAYHMDGSTRYRQYMPKPDQ